MNPSVSGANFSTGEDDSGCRIVPQKPYETSRLFDARPPAPFSKGGDQGVYMTVLEKEDATYLDDGRASLDLGERDKITHWMVIEGRQQPYVCERQVAARRSNASRDPLPRMTVARHIAKSVKQWIEGSGGAWVLSNGDTVRYENLILMRMENVSEGSWQIVLGYYPPIAHR